MTDALTVEDVAVIRDLPRPAQLLSDVTGEGIQSLKRRGMVHYMSGRWCRTEAADVLLATLDANTPSVGVDEAIALAIQGERERVNGLAAEVFGDPKATWGNMIGARACFGRVEITVASEKQVYRHSYVLDETTEFGDPTGNISYDGDTFLDALESAATPQNGEGDE